MTEHVVEHIEEALKTKQFPAYKNVFDRFTRIYIESQKVAVPMDILLMSLCECVTKNEDAIHFNNNIPLNPPLTDPVQIVEHTETTPIEETLSVPETETSVTSEDKIAPEYVSTQETTPPNNEPMTGVFKDDFIHQLGL